MMKLLTNKSAYTSLLLLAVGIGSSTSAAADPVSTVIEDVARAMGGVEQLRSANNQIVTASATGFAPLQAPTPGGEPEKFDHISFSMTSALDGVRYQTHWTITPEFPLQTHYDFTEIMNGEHGAVIGVDSLLQIPQAPMQSIRMGARLVTNFVTSPVEMIKSMLLTPNDVVLLGSKDWHNKDFTVLELNKFGKDMLLWIDNRSHLPIKTTYWDSNPLLGDSQIVTYYSDWQESGGINVPMTIKQFLKDELLLQINRESVQFNVVFIQDPFMVPAELTTPLDNKLFNIGLKYSQWFNRYLLAGIPFDLNQFSSESVFLEQVGNGIFYLRGFTHHSLIVEMDNYLILFDPVLLEERTQQVLPIIKQHWPDKKIKYVIPTHFHVDHSGGLRGYVAEGAQLVSIRNNKDFYEDVLKAKHVIYPDLLTILDKKARILTIGNDETFIIHDKHRRVHLLQVDNRHAPGLIMPYIEDQKMLFVSDLYSPGLLPVPLPPQFSFWSLDLYKDLKARNLDIDVMVGAHGGVGSYQDFINAVETTFP